MNYSSKNETIDCVSLKNASFIRIAISIWYHQNIKALITEACAPSLSPPEKISVWLNLIDNMTKKVPKLLLPESLMKKLSDVIKSMGLEILAWKEYHEHLLCGDTVVIESLNNLYWSSYGKVDRKKTAEMLVQDVRLSIISRYELACNYCLENYIPFLWSKVPINVKQSFFENPRKFKKVIFYWSCVVEEETYRLVSIRDQNNSQTQRFLFGLKSAAYTGNEVAAEYFWSKLPLKERITCPTTCHLIATLQIENILRCRLQAKELPYLEYFYNVRRFIISRMVEEERNRYNEVETLRSEFMEITG